MYSRLLAKELFERQRRRVFVGAYCPGACRTAMTRNQGERSPVEGAYGLTTLASMLLDHEEEDMQRRQLGLKADDLLPFDAPNGTFWTAFFPKPGDLATMEIEPIDWVDPAKTLSWGNLLHNLVIRKGVAVNAAARRDLAYRIDSYSVV